MNPKEQIEHLYMKSKYDEAIKSSLKDRVSFITKFIPTTYITVFFFFGDQLSFDVTGSIYNNYFRYLPDPLNDLCEKVYQDNSKLKRIIKPYHVNMKQKALRIRGKV